MEDALLLSLKLVGRCALIIFTGQKVKITFWIFVAAENSPSGEKFACSSTDYLCNVMNYGCGGVEGHMMIVRVTFAIILVASCIQQEGQDSGEEGRVAFWLGSDDSKVPGIKFHRPIYY